jgi:phosphoribosylanthranilate isomerase
MLKTKVILSSVTNLSDARYASGMGVDFIGFAINPENKRFVTAEEVKTISDWLSGVSLIGEIGNSLSANLSEYKSFHIQTTNESLISELDDPILVLDINSSNIDSLASSLQNNVKKVSFYILNVSTDELIELQPQLHELCNKYPIYISTAFDNELLTYVVEEIVPTGIVLYGSEEEKPGLSSYDGIADILEQLEED